MEEPTPTRVEILVGIPISLCSRKATTREVVMVETMMGREVRPTRATSVMFMPKPSSTTASCRIYLEV